MPPESGRPWGRGFLVQGAGHSWASHPVAPRGHPDSRGSPPTCPSVRAAGGLPAGRGRLPTGAPLWERRGRPRKGPSRLARPGAAQGEGRPWGTPGSWRRGWLLSEGRQLQPVPAPALPPCVLSSTCLTWGGKRPAPRAAWTGACPAALCPLPSLGPADLRSELGEQAAGPSLLNGPLVMGMAAGGPLGLPIRPSGLGSD